MLIIFGAFSCGTASTVLFSRHGAPSRLSRLRVDDDADNNVFP